MINNETCGRYYIQLKIEDDGGIELFLGFFLFLFINSKYVPNNRLYNNNNNNDVCFVYNKSIYRNRLDQCIYAWWMISVIVRTT